MKIQFIFFYGYLSGLFHAATGIFRLVVGKIGVPGHLLRLHLLPGAAESAPGFVPVSHNSHLGHGFTPKAVEGRRIVACQEKRFLAIIRQLGHIWVSSQHC